MNYENVEKILLQKIETAENLYSTSESLPEIYGKKKLLRNIKSELKFLLKLRTDLSNINESHLNSSNLLHLSAIVDCVFSLDGVIKICMPFSYTEKDTIGILNEQTTKRIIVDVVADYGKTWVKVVARNPTALLLVYKGAGKFGRKSLISQIQELINCAKQNEYMFEPPKIKLFSAENIDDELLNPLQTMNVDVVYLNQEKHLCNLLCNEKSIVPTQSCQIFQASTSFKEKELGLPESHFDLVPKYKNLNLTCDLPLSAITENTILNLDVTCLIAYTSNLTNGFCHVKLKDKILNEQAEQEKKFPAKYHLDKVFEGRKLICCKSAHTRFMNIFSVVGGPSEKKRALEILSRLEIVDDNPSTRCVQLREIGKINKNSKIIFGTGDTLKAVTVTANSGFIRAAKCQGENFAVFLHESRAFSEQKEITI